LDPNLKTLIAVGGWNFGSEVFARLVSDVSYIKAFAKSSADFLETNGKINSHFFKICYKLQYQNNDFQ